MLDETVKLFLTQRREIWRKTENRRISLFEIAERSDTRLRKII